MEIIKKRLTTLNKKTLAFTCSTACLLPNAVGPTALRIGQEVEQIRAGV